MQHESLWAEGLQSTLISELQPSKKHSWSNAAISPRPICSAVYFNLASSEEPSRPQNLKVNTAHMECVYQSANDLFLCASNVFLRILIWNQHCICAFAYQIVELKAKGRECTFNVFKC